MTNKTVLKVVIGIVVIIIIAIAAQKYANRHPFEAPAQAAGYTVAPTHESVKGH